MQRRPWWGYAAPIAAGGLLVLCTLLDVRGWLLQASFLAFLLAVGLDLADGIARWRVSCSVRRQREHERDDP